MQHGHRFRCRSGLVQQGGIGDLHAGQVHDHGLEIQQCFQAPLRNLGLVRGVGGVPTGIFQYVALDHRRHDGVVITQTDIALVQPVLRRDAAQVPVVGILGHAFRQIQRLLQADRRWYGLVYQSVQRGRIDLVQHGLNFMFGRAVVAAGKFISGNHGITSREG